MSRVLSKAGCEVTAVADSMEALTDINSRRPDLIILNLITPESESGFDLIEQVKTDEKTKDISFILITQKELDQDDISRLDGAIQAILNKGLLSEKDLLEELKEIISKM